MNPSMCPDCGAELSTKSTRIHNAYLLRRKTCSKRCSKVRYSTIEIDHNRFVELTRTTTEERRAFRQLARLAKELSTLLGLCEEGDMNACNSLVETERKIAQQVERREKSAA